MEAVLRAYSRLVALKANLPESLLTHEKYVKEYHEIVDLLAKEVNTSLEEFKIPHAEIRREVNYTQPDWETGEGGGYTYGPNSYCERSFLLSKLDALLSYFQVKYLSRGEQGIGFNPPEG